MAPTLRPRKNRFLSCQIKEGRKEEGKKKRSKSPQNQRKKQFTRTKQCSKAQMLLNLSNWLEQAKAKEKKRKEILKNGSGSAINMILSNISGKSRSSVKRLRNQGKKGHEMVSPSKSNGRKPIILDNFEAQLLRRIVLRFYYGAKKEGTTLDKIKAQLPLADGFPKMSRETLRKYIIKLGFEF